MKIQTCYRWVARLAKLGALALVIGYILKAGYPGWILYRLGKLLLAMAVILKLLFFNCPHCGRMLSWPFFPKSKIKYPLRCLHCGRDVDLF